MTVATYGTHTILKACVAGAVAAGADHLVMKNPDLKSCAMFGGATAAGVFGVSLVIDLILHMIPTHTPIGNLGKGVEQRVVEILGGTAGVYAMNHFLLKNEYSIQQMLPKMGIIAVADLVGEGVADVMMGERLDLFN